MSDFKFIGGGVTAAKGFTAAGIHCGIRKNKSKKDLALILADRVCAVGAVYTTNVVKGAPLIVTKKHLSDGRAQAIICNSGIANTCVSGGEAVAEEMAALVEKYIGVKADDVIVASTGVIGQPLDVTPIANGMDKLVKALGGNSIDANHAIMTTDTVEKEVAVEFTLGGKKCVIGGIAKGSGMIHPNMATMLVFMTTDAAISSAMLQTAVSEDVPDSFNMVSVDGDTSTNDMLCLLASGEAGNDEITSQNQDFITFKQALKTATWYLCKKIASDGEGASRLIECTVSGADTDADAKRLAKSVISSSLLKAAMFGADANWGRVLCALGYSGVKFDVNSVDVAFASAAGTIDVCRHGEGVDFSEELAKKILSEKEININTVVGCGDGKAVAWGCDLTYDYVKINGDYRT